MKSIQSDEKVVNELESILKKSRGIISPGDAAASTGFRIDQVKDALARLIELYEARVTMNNETGQVQFIFKYPLFRRGKKSFKEYLQIVGEWAWKIFQVIYKASIGVILIFYTILFVLVLIAMIFGGRDNDNDNKIDIGSIIGGLLRGILDAYTFSMITRDMTYGYDNDGHRYRTFAKDKNKGKSFVQSVFSFVFGPDRPQYDPLEDAKEAAAFIRRNKGKITAGNIVALSGVNYEEAEARLAEYTARFNGELDVNSNGFLVAEFTDLLNNKAKDIQDGNITFYEDEVEPPYELTGNTSGRNFGISAMNVFNFVMSILVIAFFSSGVQVVEDPQMIDMVAGTVHEFGWLVFLLGYFPFAFSILFFMIPALRAFKLPSKKKKREINILRKKLIGAILRNSGRNIRRDNLINYAKVNPNEMSLIDQTLERLVIELKGEINIDSDGTPIYSFERLSKENGVI